MTLLLCGEVHCSLFQVDGAGCGVRGDGYAPQGSPQRPSQRLQEAPRADPHPVCWSVPSIESSVPDPYSFDPDPDPAFEAENRSGSRALMTKNWGKIYSVKNFMFFDKKLHYYLSLGLHKGCPSYRRSLKREHPALQNIKFLNFFYFCGSYLPSWIRIRISIRI